MLEFNKKRLHHRSFPCEICEICKNSYFEEHLRTTASAHYTLSLVTCMHKVHDKIICEVYNDLSVSFNILYENSL